MPRMVTDDSLARFWFEFDPAVGSGRPNVATIFLPRDAIHLRETALDRDSIFALSSRHCVPPHGFPAPAFTLPHAPQDTIRSRLQYGRGEIRKRKALDCSAFLEPRAYAWLRAASFEKARSGRGCMGVSQLNCGKSTQKDEPTGWPASTPAAPCIRSAALATIARPTPAR
jgi:hypothetical protein